MAEIKITIPNNMYSRVVDSFAKAYNYQEETTDILGLRPPVPNSETKEQHAKRKIVEYVKGVVFSCEADEAADVARKQKIDDVKKNVNIG